MLAFAGDFHPVAPGADGFGDRFGVVQLFTELIKVGDIKVGSEFYRAFVRGEFPENQFDEGGFPGAVVSQEPQLVAAHQFEVEPLYDRAVAEGLREVRDLGDDFAAFFTGVDRKVHRPQAFASGGALAP